MLLGLTGGYCAGKNLAARLLAERGWVGSDVDLLGHAALEKSLPAVIELLGPGILRPDASPDRPAIGRRVFADARLLKQYEAIVHPALFELLDEVIEGAGSRDLCLNAAILYKLPQLSRCDAVLEIRAPSCSGIQRGRARDGLSTWSILSRIRRQNSLWERRGDYSGPIHALVNSGDEAALGRKLDAALDKIRYRRDAGCAKMKGPSRR